MSAPAPALATTSGAATPAVAVTSPRPAKAKQPKAAASTSSSSAPPADQQQPAGEATANQQTKPRPNVVTKAEKLKQQQQQAKATEASSVPAQQQTKKQRQTNNAQAAAGAGAASSSSTAAVAAGASSTPVQAKSSASSRPRTAHPSSGQSPTPAPPATSSAGPTAAAPSPAAPIRKPIAHRPASAATASRSGAAGSGAAAVAVSSTAAPGGVAPAPLPSPLTPPPPSIDAPASARDILVLKVGSASLSADDCSLLHLSNICALVETICQLKQRGFHVILVTSGAVAVGCQRMGLTARPKSLVTKQAIAAIGQSRLMRVYDDLFSAMSQPIAQVLLTRENLSKKHHYVNALNTIRELLRLGVVPVVNENDTVAIEELSVGDNDTLSARVASLVQAKWLFLLTDVSGLYDCDPRSNPNAKIVHVVKEIDDLQVSLGASGSIGTGGMTTKLVAASIATAAGVHTGIIKSTALGDIARMMRGDLVGTHFLPSTAPLKAHKKWIAHGLAPEGCVILDAGAVEAIKAKKSLFAPGVKGVQGKFGAGASVRLMRADSSSSSSSASTSTSAAAAAPKARVYTSGEVGRLSELGLCIVNYSSDELLRLAGAQSSEFASLLGYEAATPELAGRENIVLTHATNSKDQTASAPTNATTTVSPAAPAAATPAAAAVATPRVKRAKRGKKNGANGSAAAVTSPAPQ